MRGAQVVLRDRSAAALGRAPPRPGTAGKPARRPDGTRLARAARRRRPAAGRSPRQVAREPFRAPGTGRPPRLPPAPLRGLAAAGPRAASEGCCCRRRRRDKNAIDVSEAAAAGGGGVGNGTAGTGPPAAPLPCPGGGRRQKPSLAAGLWQWEAKTHPRNAV